MNENQKKLAENFISQRDTEVYQIRAEMGEKTVKDFAGYYLYYYKEKALERFEEECYGLEEEFFNKIVQMIKG